MSVARNNVLHFSKRNGPVDDAIDLLMGLVGDVRHPEFVRERLAQRGYMVITGGGGVSFRLETRGPGRSIHSG